ncbi:MAG TPA: methyltransferase domain-containing protein [Halomicronema sp.]
MTLNSVLKAQRKLSAISSGGTSKTEVYNKFEQVLLELDAKGDLLDFGSGTGNLVKQFQKLNRFNSLTAIDIIEKPVEIDNFIQWISWDLNETTNLPNQAFDIIISSEVIEHLENPRAVVREWFRLLRSGGTLVFSTPNNESLRSLLALLVQGHFVSFGDNCYPAHITALLRKDIERILKEAGFHPPKFIFTDVGGIPKFPEISWQTISGGLLKGLRFSDNIIAIASKPN